MALLQPPKIDDVTLTLEKDVANANFTITYRINWSEFDQATNLAYTEVVKLVGKDPNRQQDLFTGPIFANGISANGNASTDRDHPASGTFTIPWADQHRDRPTAVPVPRTVESHLGRVHGKLGLGTRGQLVAAAVRHAGGDDR